MLSLGIIAAVGLSYWFEYYGLAFWVLCYAIVNGGLAGIRAAISPSWYERKLEEFEIRGNPFNYKIVLGPRTNDLVIFLVTRP